MEKTNNTKKTLLTPGILKELGFEDNGRCEFECFEGMNYFAKNGVCLFYNTPIIKGDENSFYIGYADLMNHKYVAVAFKWIHYAEELVQIYNAITNDKI